MPQSSAPDAPQRALFAQTLGEAVTASGLNLETIVQRLKEAGAPTSRATLSYWQNGRSFPRPGRSMRVVTALEEILSLPQGALTALLADGAHPVWKSPEAIISTVTLDEALSGWGLTMGRLHRHHLIQQTWIVSSDRLSAVEISRAVTEVEAESQSAFPVVVADLPGNPVPTVRARQGCRMGRELVLRDGMLAAEVLLPQTCRHGEVYWTELEYLWGESRVPRYWLTVGLGTTVPLLTMDIIFEGEVPDEVRLGHGIEFDEDAGTLPVPVVDGRAQVVLTNPEPGLHWFQWINS